MNLQSEIGFYTELGIVDKARLMASFLSELTHEARATYGSTVDSVHDAAHLRFANEMCNRVTKLIEQYLCDDKARPADDVVIRMLLAARADKVAERMAQSAYRRAMQNFERYDTTVFLNS